MAFKRVLSVFLILLVLISTLCAFKPVDSNLDLYSSGTIINSIPDVSFQYSFASDVGTCTLQWNGGFETNTGGKGESDQIRTVSTEDKIPIEYPLGMYKYNFIFDMGVYSASQFTIKIYDTLSDFPSGQVKALYTVGSIFDDDAQTYEVIDVFVDSDDYVYIKSNNSEITSNTKNQFTANFYVNYSTLSQQYANGYNSGLAVDGSYEEGYQLGRADGIASGLYGMLTEPLGALLNFTILPSNNGLPAITFGGVLLTLIGISLVIVFLKYFAGG